MKKPQKSISDMTTRELKKYIRKQVKKANTKLKNLKKRKRGYSKAVSEELDYLQQLGIMGKRGKFVTGYRTASKAELQKKARELDYFNEWKGSETIAVAKEKDYKKYQAFINNPDNADFADYSYQQWRDLVEMFGAIGSELESYGYEDMKELHKEMNDKSVKADIVSTMKKVQDTNKDKGFDQEDFTDLIRSELFK